MFCSIVLSKSHDLAFRTCFNTQQQCTVSTPATTTVSYLLLHGAELHSDNQLCLCRHVLEDISFQPSEHVRAEQVVELLDLVLLRDISKLLQEAFQVTGRIAGQTEKNETTK